MDKRCAAYCIDLIRCLMQEADAPKLPEGLSLEALYAFAKLHGVEAMVFHGLEQLDMDEKDPLWQDWRKRTDMLLAQSIVQLSERDAIFSELPAAGIRILPVKGCWLKEQYPDIDYRQMSDVDILIRREDREKARSVMVRAGYSEDPDLDLHHDSYSKPPYMGIELHHSLLPEDDIRVGYYKDIWERAIPEESFPGVFRMKREDEYIYYFLHLFKHVMFAGTGIRSLLDSAVYRRIWPDMDRTYLLQEFEKLELAGFVRCIETIADCWFVTGDPVPPELEPMAESILQSSAYGTESRIIRNKMEQSVKGFRSPLAAKLVYLWNHVFLPLKAMQEPYPILIKLPVLLPVFWLWRLVSRLLFRPKAVVRLVKRIDKEGDKLWSEFDWRGFQSK